ncbi:MAG: hypothetical protein K8H90_02890, partial [Thermoanaerobaculia bacterium]|nr:hypothetical protein [Thermoanaerobaculia bacterium]
LRAWSFGTERRVTLYRDRVEVARIALAASASEVEIEWPQRDGPAVGTLLELHFDGWAEPGENARPLTAAFGRVAVSP